MSDSFFDAPEQQSIIKSELVTKYFGGWSDVMLRHTRSQPPRIAYIDLFSGPGKFTDGTESTPLLVLKRAIGDERLRAQLITIFNDKNPEHTERLQAAIDALPGIQTLAYRPQVSNVEVGSEVVRLFRGMKLVPTLFFIDPWGYKGLSLDLIGASIKNWGCECIFFFNYNRIYAALRNALVSGPIRDLFGEKRAQELRLRWDELSSKDRQRMIMTEFAEAVRDIGGRYVLPFGMRSQHAERTSHYIIFVSKNFRGYHIMKEVMEKLSTDDGEVKDFEYVPVKSPQLRLLDLDNPHSTPALKEVLLQMCAGHTMSVEAAYEYATVDTPYTLRHVKKAIIELEAEGKVEVDVPAEKRPKRKGEVTLSEKRIVAFPA